MKIETPTQRKLVILFFILAVAAFLPMFVFGAFQ